MRCRLYLSLVGEDPADLDARCAALADVLDSHDVACVDLGGVPAARRQAAVERLRPVVQRRGAALLVAWTPDDGVADRLMRTLAADGLRCQAVPDAARTPVAALRRALGADPAIVADAGLSRHAAMQAAEYGADAVLLGRPGAEQETIDLITWWAELMEVPCIAAGLQSPGAIGSAIDAGADFVDIGMLEWWSPAALAGLPRRA